jgi:hypothetical protein
MRGVGRERARDSPQRAQRAQSWRKGGREEGRKGGREEGRKGGREEGRKGEVHARSGDDDDGRAAAGPA